MMFLNTPKNSDCAEIIDCNYGSRHRTIFLKELFHTLVPPFDVVIRIRYIAFSVCDSIFTKQHTIPHSFIICWPDVIFPADQCNMPMAKRKKMLHGKVYTRHFINAYLITKRSFYFSSCNNRCSVCDSIKQIHIFQICNELVWFSSH